MKCACSLLAARTFCNALIDRVMRFTLPMLYELML